MDHALDAVLEIFSWIGFAGFVALALVAAVVWAADGSWRQAWAIIDRDGGDPVLRWFDTEDRARSAPVPPHDVDALTGADEATIWYRLGSRTAVRLSRRMPGLVRLVWSAAGLLALGVLCAAAGLVRLFLK